MFSGYFSFGSRTARLSLAGIMMLAGSSSIAFADHQPSESNRCSLTSHALRKACRNDIKDDFWETIAACQNESDTVDRADCSQDARDDRSEAGEDGFADNDSDFDGFPDDDVNHDGLSD